MILYFMTTKKLEFYSMVAITIQFIILILITKNTQFRLLEAENNTILDVHFSDTQSYDIHHGFQSDSTRNGWNNVVIDTDFDDLHIDSDSRLIEKEELEITVTTNGTYVWNRLTQPLTLIEKASSGLNSFWAGDSEEDTYLDSWSGSFKQKSDISLPSGGIGETRILEIKLGMRLKILMMEAKFTYLRIPVQPGN